MMLHAAAVGVVLQLPPLLEKNKLPELRRRIEARPIFAASDPRPRARRRAMSAGPGRPLEGSEMIGQGPEQGVIVQPMSLFARRTVRRRFFRPGSCRGEKAAGGLFQKAVFVAAAVSQIGKIAFGCRSSPACSSAAVSQPRACIFSGSISISLPAKADGEE